MKLRFAASIVVALAAWMAAAAPAFAAKPPVKHVFIIVFENKNYEETFDPQGDAP